MRCLVHHHGISDHTYNECEILSTIGTMGHHLTFSPQGPPRSTLSPLPDGWIQGMLGVGVIGAISFASTTILFLYMTYAMVDWHRRPRHAQRLDGRAASVQTTPDLSLGLDVKYLVASQGSSRPTSNTNIDQLFAEETAKTRSASPEDNKAGHVQVEVEPVTLPTSNPFLILIYNLLVADAISALEFMLNLVWVSSDGIFVPSSTCELQGLAAGVGAVAPSTFLAVIALHTYLVIVWGYKIRQNSLRWCIGFAWSFVILMPLLGLGISRNGEGNGGWYIRGDTWVSRITSSDRVPSAVLFLCPHWKLTVVILRHSALRMTSMKDSGYGPSLRLSRLAS